MDFKNPADKNDKRKIIFYNLKRDEILRIARDRFYRLSSLYVYKPNQKFKTSI